MTAPAKQPTGGPTEAELRELMVRGENLRQHLGGLENQREYILELLQDARRALATLDHLVNAKDGDEILFPLGGGVFINGTLAHAGKAITSLGVGVHAELATPDAQERVKARVANFETAASNVGKEIARLSEELGRINAIAESYYGA